MHWPHIAAANRNTVFTDHEISMLVPRHAAVITTASLSLRKWYHVMFLRIDRACHIYLL